MDHKVPVRSVPSLSHDKYDIYVCKMLPSSIGLSLIGRTLVLDPSDDDEGDAKEIHDGPVRGGIETQSRHRNGSKHTSHLFGKMSLAR